MTGDEAKRAILAVGDGRGFVVQGTHERFVITAAHCLPFLPPCASHSFAEERTYKTLLGSLGTEPTVWAECLFADPVGDIAVLGPPERPDLCPAYEELTETAATLNIAESPSETAAQLLSLDGSWFGCRVRRYGGPLWISDAEESIRGGISGSPILTDDWCAIGIICSGSDETDGVRSFESGPNARLTHHLPGWLLWQIS
jgi:hypothetical protein